MPASNGPILDPGTSRKAVMGNSKLCLLEGMNFTSCLKYEPQYYQNMRKEKPSSSRGEQEPRRARITTGRELTEVEEISARLSALVNLLAERGILNVKEYERIVSMRLHEISKATAFEELDDEL